MLALHHLHCLAGLKEERTSRPARIAVTAAFAAQTPLWPACPQRGHSALQLDRGGAKPSAIPDEMKLARIYRRGDVPLFGVGDPVRGDVVEPLPLAPLLEPEQFADSMRTEVTRIRWVLALVSDPDVPATPELFRARRDARVVGGGITIPDNSTR